MLTLNLKLEAPNLDLVGKNPTEADAEMLIHPGTTVTDSQTGDLVFAYGRLEGDFDELKAICRKIKFTQKARVTQAMNKDKYENQSSRDCAFGSRPPNSVFNHAAALCEFNGKYPVWYERVISLGVGLTELYQKLAPEKHARQAEIVAGIHKDWVIPGTVYTQGVINDANALGYHFDRGNIEGGLSAMVYLKHGGAGGNLILPQLNAKLVVEDKTFVLFDGQSLLHGVTPIKITQPKIQYRYSFVFYAREPMIGLGSFAEELKKKKKMEMDLRFRRANELNPA
jgi:hypothetical protein